MNNLNILPLENSEGYIWFDGEFIKWQDAKIHVLTHSLHYAGGVFEGEKSVNGKIFSIEKHTERLLNSAKTMGLEINFSAEEIVDAKNELLRINNLKNAYVRPFAWRSTPALMVRPQDSKTHLIIAAWEPRRPSSTARLKIMVSKWLKPTEQMHHVQCKSSSQYAMLSLAVKDAIDLGFDDALMLDIDGHIAECTTSNIFFISKNCLYTPYTKFCLNGITRQTVIEIAKKNKIAVNEGNIALEDVGNYESAFITGTASGLKEIATIKTNNSETNFSSHELYVLLQNEYTKLLETGK